MLTMDGRELMISTQIILCKLMLALKERSIPVIHTDANQFMKLRNNIVFFLQSLEDEYNMARLERILTCRSFPSYSGISQSNVIFVQKSAIQCV